MSEIGESSGCAICCGELNNISSIGTCIPCGHVFHEDCFQRWEATQNLLEENDNDEEQQQEEEEEVPIDEGKVTCPVCMQGVSRLQRIFLDVASPKSELHRLSSSNQSLKMDTIVEGDETGMVEDYYKALYEQSKKEMEKLRKEFRAMEGRYEEAIINQSRSHQETLDVCLEKVEKERQKKEELRKELKILKVEHKKEVKHLQHLLEEKDAEKQKWRKLSLEKTRAVAKLQQQVQERDERIEKLIGNPLTGSTTFSELIIRLNRHRDVSFPHSETKIAEH